MILDLKKIKIKCTCFNPASYALFNVRKLDKKRAQTYTHTHTDTKCMIDSAKRFNLYIYYFAYYLFIILFPTLKPFN